VSGVKSLFFIGSVFYRPKVLYRLFVYTVLRGASLEQRIPWLIFIKMHPCTCVKGILFSLLTFYRLLILWKTRHC